MTADYKPGTDTQCILRAKELRPMHFDWLLDCCRILQDIRVQQAFAARPRGSECADEQQSSDGVPPQLLIQQRNQHEVHKQTNSMLQPRSADTHIASGLHSNASSKRPRLALSKSQPKLTSLFGRANK